MKKKNYKYTLKIYNNVGLPAGELKFNKLLEAFRAYSAIKRADLFIGKNQVEDSYILFALRTLAILRLENPEVFYEKENVIREVSKPKRKQKNKKNNK